MITYKTEMEEKKYIETVTCDVCQKSYSFKDKDDIFEAQEFQHIFVNGGYGSVFGDGSQLQADICQHCFQTLMGKYLREREE